MYCSSLWHLCVYTKQTAIAVRSHILYAVYFECERRCYHGSCHGFALLSVVVYWLYTSLIAQNLALDFRDELRKLLAVINERVRLLERE